ncbi:ABC transporter permease [Mycobacterium marinum]|uniref:ABC transporter permease n=1 Tax=Mycobacterium marinum TaxID=1781 RepID=UPI001921DE6A|nr:ABC transporter permease [Mycobacterium marinum]QQW37348.1 ABC transporter permease [Mycobacterium marinum]
MIDEEVGFTPTFRLKSERSVRLLLSQSLIQARRLLFRWLRDFVTVTGAVALPILLLFVLKIVLGNLIYLMTHDNALYSIVPIIALGAAITGSTFAAIDLMRERASGLLSRFWVMPVHRASGLLSRLLANLIRVLFTTVVILGAGMILGFRFRGGLAASLVWLSVPVVLGFAFTVVVTTVALYTTQTVVVEGVELAHAIALFFSTGLVTLNQYPRWIQPVVSHQPVSYAIAAMRGSAAGGPILSPILVLLLWTVGICAACAVPSVIAYRRASTH